MSQARLGFEGCRCRFRSTACCLEGLAQVSAGFNSPQPWVPFRQHANSGRSQPACQPVHSARGATDRQSRPTTPPTGASGGGDLGGIDRPFVNQGLTDPNKITKIHLAHQNKPRYSREFLKLHELWKLKNGAVGSDASKRHPNTTTKAEGLDLPLKSTVQNGGIQTSVQIPKRSSLPGHGEPPGNLAAIVDRH